LETIQASFHCHASWRATPWDFACYGLTRFSLFGGATHGDHTWGTIQAPDLDNPGFRLINSFSGNKVYFDIIRYE